jgi:hypothetical protein
MEANRITARSTGYLLTLIGIVTVFAIVAIVLMFAAGGVFGLLNDTANAIEAILSALLAWRLRQGRQGKRLIHGVERYKGGTM